MISGAGTQSLAWPIADGPYDVVVMSADGKTAPDVQVNLGIEIPHASSPPSPPSASCWPD